MAISDPARFRYRAFISYRHHQQPAFVRRLELGLKHYAKPLLKAPMRIFRDENHLSPGIDLPQLIRSALEDSEFLILLASPEAAASVWVQDELRYWCETLQRTDRLLIVLVDGVIATDESQQDISWDETTALPRMLVSFLTRVPFYVDLRWASRDTSLDASHAEFKKALNSLVARLWRVDPIELSGLEVLQHRRNVRLRNGAVALLVVLLALSTGTAWFALRQWRSAESRRQEAVIIAAGAELDQGAALAAGERTAGDSALPLAFRRNIALATYDAGVLYENPPERELADEAAALDQELPEDQNGASNTEGEQFTEELPLDVDELYLAQNGRRLITQGWYYGVHVFDLPSGPLHGCPEEATRFTLVSTLPGERPFFLLSGEDGLQIRRLEDCREAAGIEEEITTATGIDTEGLFVAALRGRTVLAGSQGGNAQALFSAPSDTEIVGIASTPQAELIAVLLSTNALLLVDAEGRPSSTELTLVENGSVEAAGQWKTFVRLLPGDARVSVFNRPIGDGDGRSSVLAFHEAPDGKVMVALAKPTIDWDGETGGPRIEDARLERSLFDGCMRLEWLAAGSLYRLPVEHGCSESTEVEEIAFEGGFSSAAFCGPGYPYVTGSEDGSLRWWRPIGVREVNAHVQEHFERTWNDSIRALRCTRDGVVYAGFRATGIRKYTSRFEVVTKRVDVATRDPDTRLGEATVEWDLREPIRRSRTLRMIGSRGRLELVGRTRPVWSRQVADTIPYRTGAAVDAVVAVAIDEPRARIWVLTSNGRLHVIDLFTGSPIATVGTIFYSASPAIDVGFSGLAIEPATGDVRFRHQLHYAWEVVVSTVGEPP